MLLLFAGLVFFRWLHGRVYLHSGTFVTAQLILNLICFRELRPFK